MFKLFLFCLLCPFFLSAELSENSKPKTVCLNMIVKNEKDVITRCLESVLPFIDTWVIVDTGSTDGTQEIIKEFMKEIPGTLYENPWVNFEFNRNEALQLAKTTADYILFMDADDKLSVSDDFKMPNLTADFYGVFSCGLTSENMIPRFVKSSMDWYWEGVIHEYVKAPGKVNGLVLRGMEYVYINDGARSKDVETSKKDLNLLNEAIKKDPTNPRNVFYLIGTYLRLEDYDQALEACERRIQMKGWDEEVFVSKLGKGLIQNRLNQDPKTIKESYIQAYLFRPERLEPLYYLLQKLWEEDKFLEGYELVHIVSLLPLDVKDSLFLERWIYKYGLLMQHALFSAKTGHYFESLVSCEKILALTDLPEEEKKRVLECKAFNCHQKIKSIQAGI